MVGSATTHNQSREHHSSSPAAQLTSHIDSEQHSMEFEESSETQNDDSQSSTETPSNEFDGIYVEGE